MNAEIDQRFLTTAKASASLSSKPLLLANARAAFASTTFVALLSFALALVALASITTGQRAATIGCT
jgi:hypothetical protein